MLLRFSTLVLLRTIGLSCLFSVIGATYLAQQELKHREHYAREMRQIKVVPPLTKPPITQDSINRAMEMFHIEVPANAHYPQLDLSSEDRGLTTLNGWGKKLIVTVGPAAFSSWGILGSTLAHELEVHCRQSFSLIRMKDFLGLQGTEAAEREAYDYELANSERFHLDMSDQLNIRATKEYYYPLARAESSSDKNIR